MQNKKRQFCFHFKTAVCRQIFFYNQQNNKIRDASYVFFDFLTHLHNNIHINSNIYSLNHHPWYGLIISQFLNIQKRHLRRHHVLLVSLAHLPDVVIPPITNLQEIVLTLQNFYLTYVKSYIVISFITI